MQPTPESQVQPTAYQHLQTCTPLEIIQHKTECENLMRLHYTDAALIAKQHSRRTLCCKALMDKACSQPDTMLQIRAVYCNATWTYTEIGQSSWSRQKEPSCVMKIIMPGESAEPHTCYMRAILQTVPAEGEAAQTIASRLASRAANALFHQCITFVLRLPLLHSDVKHTIAQHCILVATVKPTKATLVMQVLHCDTKIANEADAFNQLTADLALIQRYQ